MSLSQWGASSWRLLDALGFPQQPPPAKWPSPDRDTMAFPETGLHTTFPCTSSAASFTCQVHRSSTPKGLRISIDVPTKIPTQGSPKTVLVLESKTFYLFIFVSGEVYYLLKRNAVKFRTSENDHLSHTF